MDVYQHNLNPLSSRFPELFDRVQQDDQDAEVQLSCSKTPYPTLLVKTEKGYSALHHPDDPVHYCRRLLQSVPELAEKQNVIVLGCGLGYLPLLVLQTHRYFRHLIILEPSISVFHQALKTVDLVPLLHDKRVRFIVGTDRQHVYQHLMGLVVEFMANPPLLIDQPPISGTFPQWAEEAKRQIHAVIQLGRSGLATKMKDGLLTLTNLLQNLELFQHTPGIRVLRHQFKNIPAVIIAAGPSLSKNIQHLHAVQDRVLLIATDTALETCLHEGIAPHFVVTVDPTELNLRHFRAERYDPSITLLFDPEARPEIPEKFSAVLTYTTDKHDFFSWLDEQSGGKGGIKKGGMVSQAGIYAASYFGCDPLILIGQDLALDPATGATHTARASNLRKAAIHPGDNAFADVSTLEDETRTTREELFWVEGIDGKAVPTMHNFKVYIHMLAEDIKQLQAQVIDATEGGAKIPGTTVMTLRDALARYCHDAISVSRIFCHTDRRLTSEACKNLRIKESLKELLQSRLKRVEKGRAFLSKSERMSLAALERKLDEYRCGIMSNPVAEYLIEYAAPKELFEFLKHPAANADEAEKRRNMIRRFESLFHAVEAATERLMPHL